MSRKDVSGRRLDLPRALGDAARSVPHAWRVAWGVLVATALVFLAPRLGWPMSGVTGTIWVAAAGLSVLTLTGALFRIGVGGTQGARALGLQPAGLQFHRTELRLVWALALNLIFLAMIVCVLALVALAVAGMAELDAAAIQDRRWAEAGAPWKLALTAIIGLAAAAIPLLLAVRLSLFGPATVGRGRTTSLDSMGVAYGSFWPLLAGLIATAAPTIALACAAYAGLAAPVTAWVWPLLLVGLQAPLTTGFLSAAYRQLEYWSP